MSKLDKDNYINDGIDLQKRKIFIQDINSNSANKIIRALTILNQKTSPIDIYINSPGGCVYDGLAIYDAISSSPCVITTHAIGSAMSIALIIFCAGDMRRGYQNTSFMSHSCSSFTSGKLKEVKIDTKEMERLNKIMANLLTDNSNKDSRFWMSKLDHDFYFDLTFAKKVGIVNIEEDE